MPDGRAALEKLGIGIPAEIAHPFRGIRFVRRRAGLPAVGYCASSVSACVG